MTGGGTGGHIYPAVAIAEALAERPSPPDVLYVGTQGGLESTIVPRLGISTAFVASRPLVRKAGLDAIATLGTNAAGVAQALRVVARFRPDCVIATGGYVTFPVVLAARMLRTLQRGRPRIAVLEPNVVAGLTNRLVGPLADETWIAFADAGRPQPRNAVVTGTPVRAAVLARTAAADARRALGLDADKTTIVVMGGSQGAQTINEAVAGMLTLGPMPSSWQIYHLSGMRDYSRALASAEGAKASIVVRAYTDDPGTAYAAADIVVARAGASTLAELAATGVPAILVPYPYATGDHQAHNAAVFAHAGAARVVPDAELHARRLFEELAAALEPQTLAALRLAARSLPGADARARIVERIDALIERG